MPRPERGLFAKLFSGVNAGAPMSTEVKHPGTILLERFLQPLGITPSRLAKSIGVPTRQVSALIAGRRRVTPDTAARLALFFDVPPLWWLVHQARYDATHLAPVEALRDVVSPYEELSDVLVTPHGVTRLAPVEAVAAVTATAAYSEEFLARLRAQAKWVEDSPRTVLETTFADGTVALVGK
jgi:addiction module HigA family antidote